MQMVILSAALAVSNMELCLHAVGSWADVSKACTVVKLGFELAHPQLLIKASLCALAAKLQPVRLSIKVY